MLANLTRPSTQSAWLTTGHPGPQEKNTSPSGDFQRLPTELILDIVTCLRCRGSAIPFRDESEEVVEDGRCRAALQALCKTSRIFRAVCLPLLWERVNVCDFKSVALGENSKAISSRLYRISSGLIENRTLAAYVRIFLIFVSTDNTVLLSKLITCLSMLPNMHTLRVYGSLSKISRHMSGATFPQVRTLLLPATGARALVRFFPQVRAVSSFVRPKGWSDLVGLFDAAAETLEVLDGFIMSPETINYLVDTTRNLKIVRFPDWVSPDTIVLFKPLTKLHTIEMVANPYAHRRQRAEPKSQHELDAWMAVARETLAGHEGRREANSDALSIFRSPPNHARMVPRRRG